MITLSIDSSSKAATAALLKDGKLMSEINLNDKHEHSVVLMGMIDKLLKYNDLTIDDIDNFAVSKGPGSFTGLRIGMAAVKGMSFGSGKPYISISSLDALAYTAGCFDGLICPVMDALRNSVYTALYHASCSKEDGSVSLERLTEYEALDISDLTELIKSKNEKVMFIGDGVDKYKNYFLENCPDAYFPPQHLNIVHASALGELAFKLLSQGIHDEPESAPFYLKKPQAQRELEEKKKRLLR